MDDKQFFNGRMSVSAARTKHKSGLGSYFAVLALGLLCFVTLYSRLPVAGVDKARAHRYPGESISWKPCGDSYGREVECAKIKVPIDQFDLTQHAGKTFKIPLVRIRGKPGSKNLFINPGGPGVSGTGFLHRKGAFLSKIVGDDFHLLSFDPRGVNSSSPRASCYPSAEMRAQHYKALDRDSTTDSASRYVWTQNFVRACEENLGDHGKYLNTPQTAADMNSILDAVGQKDMVYWGLSYGTLLGQTYASLFPERSQRIIIDGVVNQVDWYSSLIQEDDFLDTQTVLDGFFEECMKHADKCALSRLASTKEGVQEKVMEFLEELKQNPIPVFINAKVYGTIEYAMFWNKAIFGNLYTPSTWLELATQLSELMQGNATSAFLEYGVEDPAEATDNARDVVQINDGMSGADFWPQGRESILETLAPLYNQSEFAFFWNRGYYAKQQWRIARTHTFKPLREGIRMAHPMLILSTTYDPITPLKSARHAEAAHVGSRLVEVKGYGHSSIGVRSACVARHVRDFLRLGTMPEQNATCEVDAPYFQERDPEEGVWAKLAAAKTDEEQVRVGQDLLAQHMD